MQTPLVQRTMKQEHKPSRKQQTSVEKWAMKSPCGTLSYLAECRGAVQRSGMAPRPTPSGILNRFERRLPAG